MASGSWIESTYSLAALPGPAKSDNVKAAAVTTLASGKKRKRYEVVTAIDGEGINIYNVEDSSLVTSYSIPPNTHFDAAPCSIYHKRSKHDTPRRLTYAASRTSATSRAVRLSCHEASTQEPTTNASKAKSQNLPSGSPVVLNDVLSIVQVTQEETESHQVVALQRDGHVTCVAEEANQILWSSRLSDLPTAADAFDMSEDFEVRHADLSSFDIASHGILSGREDILASMNVSNTASTYVLSVIGTSPSVRHQGVLDLDLHIYALQSSPSRNTSQSHSSLRQLLSWSIPQAVKRKAAHSLQYHMDAKSGTLVELIDGKVISYDLKSSKPRIIDTFTSRDKLEAMLPLSSSIVLAASASKFSVYDTKFGSLLATQDVPAPAATSSKRARQSLDSAELEAIHFVDYFKIAGNAIALRGNEMLVVQTNNAPKSKKRSGTLLIDSLARGRFDSRLHGVAQGAEDSSKKRKRTKIGSSTLFKSPEMDALLEDNNIEGFEKEFAKAINLAGSDPSTEAGQDGGEVKPPAAEDVQWQFPEFRKLRGRPANRPQALYALSKLFSAASMNATSEGTSLAGSLKLDFYPENIFLWLVHTGQLRADNIQRALDEYTDFDGHVKHGDMVRALASFDGDLSLVNYVLIFHPNLHIDEIVTAVKLIMHKMGTSNLPKPEHKLLMDTEFTNAASTTGALTGGVGVGHGPELPQLDGAAESKPAEKPMEMSDEDIESVTDAAIRDVDELMKEAYDMLDTDLPIRDETLRRALTRLNALPREEVTQALREHLSQHELLYFIHTLRVELDQGGWTTRYGDREDADTDEEPLNHGITVIATMLSRAVDAVGMSGWLTTSSSKPFDDIDQTLTQLRGEISNTLEGVHEATFISGVLADLLRYQHRLAESPHNSSYHRKAAASRSDERMWKQGKTVVVEDAPSALLPMGLGTEHAHGVKMTVGEMREKHMSGMVTKKSARDVGREIRRGLPAYVFERIRF